MTSRRLVFLLATAGTLVAVVAVARPRLDAEPPRFEMFDPAPPPSIGSPVFEAASAGTTYFGGTVWDPVDGRYEAMVGGTWTFNSGVASSFSPTVGGMPVEGLNPFKSPVLHTIMEGWVGFDNTFGRQTEFRRLGTGEAWLEKTGGAVVPCVGAPYIPGGGNTSFYAGMLPAEGLAACYADSGGYGDDWSLCIELTSLAYSGLGNVTWSFGYASDTEPGFDYAYAIVDISGNDDDVTVLGLTGVTSGTANLVLYRGETMRVSAGPVHFKYCVAADGAYSDQDGLYETTCGAFTVDNVSITGGGMAYGPEGFETGAGGWVLSPSEPGLGGEWSDIVALADLPATKTTCPCRLADSVLVFENLNVGGHGLYQDNLAASPWIDLAAASVDGAPGKFVEFDYYYELPLLNYIFPQVNVKWYPYTCPHTGAIMESPWSNSGFIIYFGPNTYGCPSADQAPYREYFGQRIDADAERVQIALGVLNYCRFYANCSQPNNGTPWYDNVRFVLFGALGAPLIATRTVDQALDAFPEAGGPSPATPGRLDANLVKGNSSPEPGTALGDTLTVQGGGINPLTGVGGTEVQVVFNVRPGPGINTSAFNAWLTKHNALSAAEAGTRSSLGTWYYARMDTAEQGGVQTAARSWMTAYHETAMGASGPLFMGPNDMARAGDLDPRGNPRLQNDIFPDDLFTPGTRVNYFYRAHYVDETSWFELPTDGIGYTFGAQEGTPGYFEWECLPSSMAPDTSWNCLLYVDHFDGRGAQIPIENALSALLPGGSPNFENVRWDRYDVEAPSSGQASLGGPGDTQYGAGFSQLLAYTGILWNSGNLSAFNLVKEDADVLDPWLARGPYFSLATKNRLYLSGDGMAQSITQEQASDPDALALLNGLCGVVLHCGTYRDASCNASGATDVTACVTIDPVGAGTPAEGRPLGTVAGEGNGCPSLRSFDVLSVASSTRYDAVVSPDEEYRSAQNPGPTGDLASIVAAHETGFYGFNYRTAVDGVSVHYRRDQTDCAGVGPVEARLAEVLGWMGLLAPEPCTFPTPPLGVPGPTPLTFVTALTSLSPNPLHAGSPATIGFTLARDGDVRVEIFDLAGRLVRRVFHGPVTAGAHQVTWSGLDETNRPVAGGVYFARFRALGEEATQKLVVVTGGARE